ncbi:MAG: DNA-binding PadR family transcriptional regulator [Cryomorphaceae bacterium]|jgi:DNA-binding PadR family transcriptional regulator
MSKNHLYKGTLSSVLLKLLSEEGRMYGYELSKKAKSMTNGDLDITEGALYPALHKMEANGLVTTEVEMIGKRSRKYYKLTESGGKEAKDRIAELKEYASNLQLFLNPKLSNG